jgi:hypothetical protein
MIGGVPINGNPDNNLEYPCIIPKNRHTHEVPKTNFTTSHHGNGLVVLNIRVIRRRTTIRNGKIGS